MGAMRLPQRRPPAPLPRAGGAGGGGAAAARRRRRAAPPPRAAAAPAAEDITSTQNPVVKHAVRVRTQAAYRAERGAALVAGEVLLREIILADGGPALRTLFVLRGAAAPPKLAARAGRVLAVPEAVMAKVAGVASPPALAAEVAAPEMHDFCGAAWPPRALRRLLVLEGCQDPGNLGTLLRTALALGWQGALLLPGCADPVGDKALRAGRGAAFRLPLAAAASLGALDAVVARHGLVALAADPRAGAGLGGGGDPGGGGGGLGGGSFDGGAPVRAMPVALVLGSEGRGLSGAAAARCRPVGVPMARGAMESLNVGAAGAVLMAALGDGAPALAAALAAEAARAAAAGGGAQGPSTAP